MAGNVIKLDIEGMKSLVDRFDHLAEQVDNAKADFLLEYGNYAFESTQDACPVDNGLLISSGELIPGENGFTIRYTAPYAVHVEYGWTRTSPIVPVHKKALAWEAGRKGRLMAGKGAKQGNRVVVTRVDKPAHFAGISYARVPLRRSLAYVQQFWAAAMKKNVKEAT